MPNNTGYINTVAVMQKFFDQAISGNWSYNPTHYENNEVPMSQMIQDLLTTYKMGWKTSYYQNTYDYKTDPSELIDDPAHNVGWHDNVKDRLLNVLSFKAPTTNMMNIAMLVQFNR